MGKEIDFFDKTSASYLAEYEKETSEGYSFRIRREKVLSLIPKAREKGKALDIGCGPGIMVGGLLDKNYVVNCIDAAPEMVNLTQEKYKENQMVAAEIGKVDNLNFPDSTFDLIISMGLLEYLGNDEQEKTIKEIKRVAKKEAVIILTFPNKTSPCRIFNRAASFLVKPISKTLRAIAKKPSQSLTHREYNSKKTMELLEKNGLKVSDIIYYNFKLIPYPFDKCFPKLAICQSKLFENLDKTFLKFLGTGFIIKARKI